MGAEERWCSAAPVFPPRTSKKGEGWIYLNLNQEAMQEPGWAGGDRAEGCPWGQTHLSPSHMPRAPQTHSRPGFEGQENSIPKDRDFLGNLRQMK